LRTGPIVARPSSKLIFGKLALKPAALSAIASVLPAVSSFFRSPFSR